MLGRVQNRASLVAKQDALHQNCQYQPHRNSSKSSSISRRASLHLTCALMTPKPHPVLPTPSALYFVSRLASSEPCDDVLCAESRGVHGVSHDKLQERPGPSPAASGTDCGERSHIRQHGLGKRQSVPHPGTDAKYCCLDLEISIFYLPMYLTWCVSACKHAIV